MLASLIGGLLYDHLSVVTTLYIALSIGIIGAFIMFFATAKQRKKKIPLYKALVGKFREERAHGYL